VLRCTATDANGIRSIVVGNTGQQIQTDCGDKSHTIEFTVPHEHIKRNVFIVDCANQRERAKFTIRPDGSVTAPTFKFV